MGYSHKGWKKIVLKFKKLKRKFERKIKSMRGERFSLGQFADCHYTAFMTLHVIGAKCLGFVIAGSMW